MSTSMYYILILASRIRLIRLYLSCCTNVATSRVWIVFLFLEYQVVPGRQLVHYY